MNPQIDTVNGKVPVSKYQSSETSTHTPTKIENGDKVETEGSGMTENNEGETDTIEEEEPSAEIKLSVNKMKKKAKEEAQQSIDQQKFSRLNFLLERSSIYSKFLSEKLQTLKSEKKEIKTEETGDDISSGNVNKKRKVKNGKKGEEEQIKVHPNQPKLLSGATLKDYQLEGMEWLISLYENGLNGILADEMGLGKTIQTIAFLSYLIEQGIKGPFLIVVPLTTLINWMNEFAKFAPKIECLMFYGTKDERNIIKKKYFLGNKAKKQVILTSYEVAMKDRSFLQRFAWKYLVVDEGHRLKNFECKLSLELKKIGAANRLLLTGTPLHNNLSELWALLNFILPDIFDDVSSFIDWFDFSEIQNNYQSNTSDPTPFNENQKNELITKLHSILKPFLLRRLKTDVETSLPKKREYILNAHLTLEQKKYYEAVLTGDIRKVILDENNEFNLNEDQVNDNNSNLMKDTNLSNQHLLNKFMQLRKVCNHPYLFSAPYDKDTGEYIYDPKAILNNSGKMLLLDKLLKELINRGHRVLIFTQFTRLLDILETYMIEVGKWEYCRIDGTVRQESRQTQINEFNTDDKVKVFLISTRAGGLGINLATADSVIFFDSDWNPQMDLQAQDRAHRIGQKKPVIVYRLITANTVESKLIGRANSKRLLEKLVIHKNKFKGLGYNSNVEEETSLFKDMIYNNEYEQVIIKPGDELISKKDLNRILDRSDAAFEQAELLLKNQKNIAVTSESNAFQLYETANTEENKFKLVE
ncbi:hypothetical protein K502DRAFT_322776 [Neoconidiobolus thromboides FSU 785]|nr:hypothetical protein K502DRAFT_322776 [Neoconidiobolus thromboides FSU 785]